MANNRAFVRVDVTGFLRDPKALLSEVEAAREDMQIEAAQIGRDKMREYIETRGTGKTWAFEAPAKVSPRRGTNRSGSFPGRVNTGQMRDSVRIRLERGQKKTLAAFGWIDPPRGEQKYFEAQEYGFSAGGFRPPQQVDGMFALRDSRRYVVKLLPRLATKYANRIARGKY